PGCKLVAYGVPKADRAQHRRNPSIWMVAIDGSRAPWHFTTSPQSTNSPRWSPDGKWLAFLSSRPAETTPPAGSAPSGASTLPQEQMRDQVYVLSMDGGEGGRLTNLKRGGSSFGWRPGGQRL